MTNEVLPTDEPIPSSSRYPSSILLAVGVVLLSAVAGYIVLQADPWGERTELPASFELNLDEHMTIDAQRIAYKQNQTIELTFEEARAIATGPQDEIFIAGDRSIQIFDAEGGRLAMIELEAAPTCLA